MPESGSPWWMAQCDESGPLDAVTVRDLLVECFFYAQAATFAHSKSALGQQADPAELREALAGAVRAAFRRAGGDYEHPDGRGILMAADALAAVALEWGTSPAAVEHHRAEIARLVDRLPE